MRISISIAFLITAISIFYYLVIYLPQKDRSNQASLINCINFINQRVSDSSKTWTTLQSKDDFNLFLQEVQEKRDECYKEYPIK